jgi:ketosteroid isomerase-like protein
MKSPKELLLEYLDVFTNPQKAAALFAEDARLELPFMESVGLAPVYTGRAEIQKMIETILSLVPDWKFENTQVFIESEDQVAAEYEVRGNTSHTQRPFYNLFFGRLVAENGKIKLLREGHDSMRTAKALFKNAVGDIPNV